MPERVTRVTLDAVVSGYVHGLSEAEVATRKLDTAAGKLKAQKEAFNGIGKAAVAFGAFAAAGVGLAVAKFAEFDKQMSAVQAATHESAANMALLRDAALDAGAKTVFSATESASAIEELAKAGLSTSEILGGALDGALSLAAASGMDVAAAAEVAAKTLNQFNLEGSKTEHVADLLAAGAGKASGDVSDLGAALAQVGQVANGAGLTIEETTTALAAFASQGLLGSDAGTSFKTMLGALTPNTAKARDEMERLGISAFDASGKFIGLENFAGQLKQGLSGLTDEQRSASLEIMFGSDAVRAATSLYNEGSVGIAEWSEKVNDSGYAAETAALRMDNLSGDIEKLGGAFDTALIKSGSAANEALRGLVQGVTAIVDAFASAPDGVQQTTLALGGLTAAVGLAGGAALLAVPKVAAFNAAIASLGTAGLKTKAILLDLSKTVAVVAAVALAHSVREWSNSFTGATKSAEDFKEALTGSGGLKTAMDSFDSGELRLFGQDNGASNIKALSGDLKDLASFAADFQNSWAGTAAEIASFGLIDSSLGRAKQNAQELDSALASLAAEGHAEMAAETVAQIADQAGISVKELMTLLPEYASAAEHAGDATGDVAGEVDTFTESADAATQSAEDFVEALRGLGESQLSLNDANRAVEASLDDFQAKVEKNGQTLDITTEAGRENQAALDDIAKSYLEAAAATVEQTGKQEDAIPVIQAGRDAIVNAGRAAGMSADQANAYADELGLIPDDVRTNVDLVHEAAMAKARDMARMIQEIPNSKTVYLYVQEQRQVLGPGQQGQTFAGANGMMHSYANGGFGGEGFYDGRQGSLYKFAEPETRWEAFISGRPGQEARNRGLALEAYGRLGGQLPQGDTVNNFNYTAQPIREMDERVAQTIWSREFARKVAG